MRGGSSATIMRRRRAGHKSGRNEDRSPPIGFPANRENNSEFRSFAAMRARPRINSRSSSSELPANSLPRRNRELFLYEQRIHPSDQGIYWDWLHRPTAAP
jgi:hypothetical protein